MPNVLLQSPGPAFGELDTETWVILSLDEPELQILEVELGVDYAVLSHPGASPGFDGFGEDFNLLEDVSFRSQFFSSSEDLSMRLVCLSLFLEFKKLDFGDKLKSLSEGRLGRRVARHRKGNEL